MKHIPNRTIVKKLVVDLGIDGDVIHSVVEHSLYRAIGAMQECNSVEISGWGRFYFNYNKAKKKMRRYISLIYLYLELPEEQKKRKNCAVYNRAHDSIVSGKYLIKKLQAENELVTDFRRVEEQFNASQRHKEENRGNSTGENGNMQGV